jgi:Protein of unknown function (DUF1097)
MTSQAKPPAVVDIGRFNIQTMAAAITASAAATTCASFDWPVWAMLLGWVASLTGGRSLKDVFRSYVCLAAGIAIGTAATLAIGELSPIIGPLAYAPVVFAVATIVVSMREMPYVNHVPGYLLGVSSVLALHPKPIGLALVEIAAPSAVGAIGAWLAYLWQTKISNYFDRPPQTTRAQAPNEPWISQEMSK